MKTLSEEHALIAPPGASNVSSRRRLEARSPGLSVFLALFGLFLTLGGLPRPTEAASTRFEGDLPRAADVGFRVWNAGDPPRLEVRSVAAGGPAARAELKTGDVVVAVGQTTVRQPDDGRRALQAITAGDRLTLTVRRGNRTHTVRYALPERAPEAIAGVHTVYGVLRTPDGARLRTIVTRPDGTTDKNGKNSRSRRLPAILFVDWLSCSTVEVPASNQGGWAQMMRGIIQRSGAIVMRTEKAGVGDSTGGPCSALDYVTNLNHHRAALAQLLRTPDVDPDKVFVFGASMGGNMAPLVAAPHKVAGVIVWGGGARTWFERTLAFERNRRERGGLPAAQLAASMKTVSRFLFHYLVEQKTPEQIAAAHPDLADVWEKEIRGTQGDTMYGRPIAFHHQAQAQNWPSAWDKIRAPVLVMFGEYDWFEDAAGHALIARIVNRNVPGAARYIVFPRMNHHFELYADDVRAVAEERYDIGAQWAVDEVTDWMSGVLR